MTFNGFLNPLRFNANVPLCGFSGAVLQKPLHQGNVTPIGFVDFRCIPFPEAVGSDALIAQVIEDNRQLLLDGSFCQGKDSVS